MFVRVMTVISTSHVNILSVLLAMRIKSYVGSCRSLIHAFTNIAEQGPYH